MDKEVWQLREERIFVGENPPDGEERRNFAVPAPGERRTTLLCPLRGVHSWLDGLVPRAPAVAPVLLMLLFMRGTGTVHGMKNSSLEMVKLAHKQGFPSAEHVRESCRSSSFWSLWQEHREPLQLQCMRLMAANSSDAEEALDIAMLKALQGFLKQTGPLVNARAWLSRVVHSTCMDIHRARKHFVPPADDLEAEALPDCYSLENGLDKELLDRERDHEIRRCVQALPPGLRAPLEMRFWLDMSYPEIAVHLCLTNCNARKRVQLACARLRAALADMRNDAGLSQASSEADNEADGD